MTTTHITNSSTTAGYLSSSFRPTHLPSSSSPSSPSPTSSTGHAYTVPPSSSSSSPLLATGLIGVSSTSTATGLRLAIHPSQETMTSHRATPPPPHHSLVTVWRNLSLTHSTRLRRPWQVQHWKGLSNGSGWNRDLMSGRVWAWNGCGVCLDVGNGHSLVWM